MKLFLARMRNRWLKARLRGGTINAPGLTNLSALDHIKGSDKAESLRYVVIDLETTGLNLHYDHIISIGALRVVNGRIRLGDMFQELIKPGKDIEPASIKIHGIVPDILVAKRSDREMLDDFLQYLGTDILVAHNAGFDLHFLNKVMQRNYHFRIQNLVIDTLLLSRSLMLTPHPYPYTTRPDDHRFSLDNLAEHFGIEVYQRHTALGDALATAMIFQRMLCRMEEEGTVLLRHLVRKAALIRH